MSIRGSRCLGLALALTCLWQVPAWATFANFKSYKEAYPGKEPKAYSCKVCHQDAIGRKDNLNPYGLDLQKSKAPGDAKSLTVDDYRAVEKDDADQDGVSNLDEINAGTAPGDPASVPAGVTPKPAHDTPSTSTPTTAPSGDTKP